MIWNVFGALCFMVAGGLLTFIGFIGRPQVVVIWGIPLVALVVIGGWGVIQ